MDTKFLAITIILSVQSLLLWRGRYFLKIREKIKNQEKQKCKILCIHHLPGRNMKYKAIVMVRMQIVIVYTINSFAKRYKEGDNTEVVFVDGKEYFAEESFINELILLFFVFIMLSIILLIRVIT